MTFSSSSSSKLPIIQHIDAVPAILRIVADTTGLGFICVARVTQNSWTACAVLDRIGFGLEVGGELDVTTTLCSEVRDSHEPIVINHASADANFCQHPVPKLYGFESYLAFPIYLQDGTYFGNLCALDPEPAAVSDIKIAGMMTSFARLISLLISSEEEQDSTQHALRNQRKSAQLHLDASRVLEEQSNYLRRLFEQAPGFTAVVRGPEHVYDIVNEAYYQLVGHRELIGRPVRQALPELAGQGYFELLDQVYFSGEAFVGHDMDVAFQRFEGSAVTNIKIDLLFQPVLDTDGRVSGIFIQGYDITDRKRAQDELRISNERLKLAIEGTGEGVWDWDLQSGKTHFSRRWKELLGYEEHEIQDGHEEWESRMHPDDLPSTLQLIRDCLEGRNSHYVSEYRLRCKDGSWKWFRARATVVARDAAGMPTRMTGLLADISAQRASEELIWRQANFDALTELPNRRLFRDRLEQEVKKSHFTGQPIALLFIDLDRFKEANDLLGHDIGDVLLQHAAQRISACVRESDTVARLGGDEFTVILAPLHTDAHVEPVALSIVDALSQPFCLGNEVIYLSASVGITLYPQDAADPESLIRNADQAMYAAKNAGRNRFSYFTRSLQEQAQNRLRLANDLRKALETDQLRVHYQPVIDLRTGRILKAEALIRWHHPRLGLVEPSLFIPLAEETGLINQIGDWVFKEAAGCSKRWSQQLHRPFQISVNRSPVQFLSRVDNLNWSEYLASLGLTGKSIAVEITEGLLLNASANISEKLLQYRDAGIQVAIDDFGTGYSSMAYLKKFDIDYLKIDQSFVQDMASDAGDRAIVRSIIAMAHELGLKVIAEGIETDEQKELLTSAGCDFGQGYLFSSALCSSEFERRLNADALLATA